MREGGGGFTEEEVRAAVRMNGVSSLKNHVWFTGADSCARASSLA